MALVSLNSTYTISTGTRKESGTKVPVGSVLTIQPQYSGLVQVSGTGTIATGPTGPKQQWSS